MGTLSPINGVVPELSCKPEVIEFLLRDRLSNDIVRGICKSRSQK